MFRPQTASIRCPQCGASYQAPVFSIIDVGQVPELKQVVLSGQLNASQCPKCRNVNYLAAPILYHDPEHEFLGVFIPTQVNLGESQRQKIIGDLSKALMDSLPAEQRRFYMLNPQQFLTMESLTEKLLGFEGITPEMIVASRRKVELIEELARVKDDAIAFNLTVKENEKYLDQEFFTLLSNLIVSAQGEAQTPEFQMLSDLREKLLPVTEIGRRIQKQRQAIERLGRQPSGQSVFDAIVSGDLDEVEAITIVARTVIDYQFLQDFTARIESSSGEERQVLETKRDRMLQIMESFRAAEQEAAQSAGQVIQELLTAGDMSAAVQEMLPMIDQGVMSLLLANINEAEQRGAAAAAGRLRELWELIVEAMEQNVPPEMRLLYDLAEAEYPEGTRAILRDRKGEVNEQFLGLLQTTIRSMEQEAGDDAERVRLARHLRNVLTQARLGV